MSGTATSRIISEAHQTTEIKDSKGRTLTLRKLTSLDQLQLYRALGPEQSSNQQIFYMTSAAVSVSKIDGMDMRFPRNERMIDDTITRLGDEGLAAIMSYQLKQIQDIQSAAEAAQNEDGEGGTEKPNPLPESASS